MLSFTLLRLHSRLLLFTGKSSASPSSPNTWCSHNPFPWVRFHSERPPICRAYRGWLLSLRGSICPSPQNKNIFTGLRLIGTRSCCWSNSYIFGSTFLHSVLSSTHSLAEVNVNLKNSQTIFDWVSLLRAFFHFRKPTMFREFCFGLESSSIVLSSIQSTSFRENPYWLGIVANYSIF